MTSDDLARAMLESLRSQTDEEAEAVWDRMIRDGIIDSDGNVLKRFPGPPDWLTQANGRPAAPESEPPVKPKKTRPRKKS